jgi:type IV pilus assembly protein PilC
MSIILTTSVLVLYIYLGLKKPAIALVTLPFIVFTLLVNSALDEDIIAGSIACIIIFSTFVAILMSKRRDDSPQWPHICVRWILIIFFFLLLFIALGIVFGPLGIFGIVFLIIFISSIIAYGITSHHATAAYVISTIGSSIRQNLPLPMALESAASGCTDKQSWILRRIQKWLVQGYSLSESIKRGYSMCPGYAVAMIAAAERIDQLPLAMQSIEADMIAKTNERRKIRPVHPFYPIILMTFMFMMILGVMTFIIPQFKSVLTEMIEGAQLPFATRLLMDISFFIAYEYNWLIVSVLLIIVFILFPFWLYGRFRPRRPNKPYLFSRIGDYIKWHLPILHSFEKNYLLVQVIELLRLSLNAGCTVNEAIANTLGLDLNNCFRERLRRWLQKVERGDNITDAAKKCKLGSSLAWAFNDKINQGNTPVILETLENFYRLNYSYNVNLARYIMWPCIILVMGLIVGFVVFAVYSPGIHIINTLSNMVVP